MDEFDLKEWPLRQARGMVNMYPSQPRIQDFPEKPRWTIGGIVVGLVIVALCGLVIWGALDDLTEHFKPAQPVPVQEEKRLDINGQIRTLERMIAEAKQLNADLLALHKQLSK